ncbi:hypothetical protein HK405_002515, partial [Cladochytrium tenue]
MTWFRRKSTKRPAKAGEVVEPRPKSTYNPSTKPPARTDELHSFLGEDNLTVLPPTLYSGRIVRRRPVTTVDPKPASPETSSHIETSPVPLTPTDARQTVISFDGRSRTSLQAPSISASDYNHSGAKRARKLKYHTGPIDKRALSSLEPHLLLEKIEDFFLEEGFEVLSNGEETG